MKHTLLLLILLSLSTIATAQIAPPYFTTTVPSGGERGKQVTLTIQGFNLTGASEVLWDKAGISAVIVTNTVTAHDKPRPSTDPTKRYQGDNVTRNRLTLDLTIAPGAEAGLYRFRLRTPLGTTNLGAFYVTALPETKETEANDTLITAQALTLPTTVVGEMNARGDRDHFKFSASTGQQLVFEVVASAFGSKFDGVLTLLDATGKQLATNNDHDFRRDPLLAYEFKQSGEYVLQVTDFEQRGMSRTREFDYRLQIGELPYIASHFPLGFRQGTTGTLALDGANLSSTKATIQAPAKTVWNPVEEFALAARQTSLPASNSLRLALGNTPELNENTAEKSLAAPQSVTLPVTINGRVHAATKTGSAEDFYRFTARKGQTLWLEIGAQRYGSPLDSVLEIYDAQGQLVPRAILRSVFETVQTLNDRDSASRGIRILNWNGLNADDYVLIGNEVLQVDVLPKGPDEDIFFKNVNGQRLGFFDTTPEAHAVNTAIYKVSVHPPDAQLPSNGLPQVKLFYRNDDGGPMYGPNGGKDSRLTFVAPADGAYTVRVRDVRGWQGESYAYRLSIREPKPDFTLTVDPENPNVPRGAALPINVTAYRAEGFTGEIEIKLHDLPPGFSATTGIIRPGVNTVTILLSAAADVPPTASCALKVTGTAVINGQRVMHSPVVVQEKLALISVVDTPELLVWTDQPLVTLTPGGTAWVSLKVKREKEFKGRIPFDIRNLPHGVIVKDVGLSGVLITEDETTQRFELAAEPWTAPVEQPIIVIGRVETASPQRAEFPAQPFKLVIPPKPIQ